MTAPRASAPGEQPTAKSIVRVVAIVVASVLALYLLYLLRTPLGWLVLATFVAVAVSAPVNVFSRKIPRGAAIVVVYLCIVLIPIGIGAILVPPVVKQTVKLVNNLPAYTQDLNDAFEKNDQLRKLNEDYDVTSKLDNVADDLVSKLGATAGTLADIGAGVVSSLFALVTILVMSMFMVSRGPSWRETFLRTRPPAQAEAIRRASDRIATAVSGYIGGALAQAAIAGIFAFTMLTILGVPSPLPLAVVIALLDLIPLVGATIGAVIVGIVTLFTDFPTVTIIWTIFAIVYQQFENYVVQPRIQSRAAELDPFIVVVAAIFGGTLLGVIGALLAIPAAAAIQIAVREFLAYRRGDGAPASVGPSPPGPAASPPATS